MFFFSFKHKTTYEISECDWSSDVCSSDLKQKTAYEISECDWSSDVCSSDLVTFRNLVCRLLLVTDALPISSRRRHTRFLNVTGVKTCALPPRSEERRVGKEFKISVDLGGRRIIKKKNIRINLIERTKFLLINFTIYNLVKGFYIMYFLFKNFIFFFFKQKTAYEISECDWSSDVCSSDLTTELQSHSEISYAVFCLKYRREIGREHV